MVEIIIWLCFFVAIPIVIFFLFLKGKRPGTPVKPFLMNFIIIYIFIVLTSYGYGMYLEYQWRLLDTNGDGFYPPYEEMTNEQRRIMALLTNDVGRNFSVITGLFLAFFHTLLFSLIVWGYKKLCLSRTP